MEKNKNHYIKKKSDPILKGEIGNITKNPSWLEMFPLSKGSMAQFISEGN